MRTEKKIINGKMRVQVYIHFNSTSVYFHLKIAWIRYVVFDLHGIIAFKKVKVHACSELMHIYERGTIY